MIDFYYWRTPIIVFPQFPAFFCFNNMHAFCVQNKCINHLGRENVRFACG
jgi:hypothetical protein